jgi:hypothetical protein
MRRVEIEEAGRATARGETNCRGRITDARSAVWRRMIVSGSVALAMAGAPERAAAYGSGPGIDTGGIGGVRPERHTPSAPKIRSPAILLAHAIVVRTSPAQGGVAAENIGKVDVWYDAGIRDSLAALAVISASGQRVDKRDAAIDRSDPSHVSVSVNPLTPGKYTVRYRALSADGHMVSGAWDFEVPN